MTIDTDLAMTDVNTALERLEQPWPTTFERQRDVATIREELRRLQLIIADLNPDGGFRGFSGDA